MRSVFRLPGSTRRPTGQAAPPEDAVEAADPGLADLVAALTAEPAAHELDGFERPWSAYTTQFPPGGPTGSTRRRTPMPIGRLGARAAAAVGGAALGLAATAAAVALSMPSGPASAPLAPAATAATPSASPSGRGPDATGPAAHGLCTAWSRHRANGSTEALDSPPMRNLAAAAGGAAGIEAYCAGIEHPGKGRPDQPGQQGRDKGDKARDKDKDDEKGKPTTTPGTSKPKATPPAKPPKTPKPTASASPTPSTSPSPTTSSPTPSASPTG